MFKWCILKYLYSKIGLYQKMCIKLFMCVLHILLFWWIVTILKEIVPLCLFWTYKYVSEDMLLTYTCTYRPIYIHGKIFVSMYLYLTMLSKRRQVCDTIYIRRPLYGLLTRNGKCNGIENQKAVMSLCSTYCIVDVIELTNRMHCIIFILDAYLTRNSSL